MRNARLNSGRLRIVRSTNSRLRNGRSTADTAGYCIVRLPSQGLDQAVILSNAFLIDTVQQQEKLNIDFTRFIC